MYPSIFFFIQGDGNNPRPISPIKIKKKKKLRDSEQQHESGGGGGGDGGGSGGGANDAAQHFIVKDKKRKKRDSTGKPSKHHRKSSMDGRPGGSTSSSGGGGSKSGTTGQSDSDDDDDEDCAATRCMKPSGRAVNWVQCDGGCEMWFHLICVGLTKLDVADVEFLCSKCKKKRDPEGIIDITMDDAEDDKTTNKSSSSAVIDLSEDENQHGPRDPKTAGGSNVPLSTFHPNSSQTASSPGRMHISSTHLPTSMSLAFEPSSSANDRLPFVNHASAPEGLSRASSTTINQQPSFTRMMC